MKIRMKVRKQKEGKEKKGGDAGMGGLECDWNKTLWILAKGCVTTLWLHSFFI